MKESKAESVIKQKPTCLIIDDTTLSKTGKMMEFIGLVFDHLSGQIILGYKLLAMAFFDGTSTLVSDLYDNFMEANSIHNYSYIRTDSICT